MEYNKGLTLAHLESYTRAIEYFDKALAIHRKHSAALDDILLLF
jgi:tetratricopeptide (TPR) repeat protein